ncbi:hypothetical protein D1841_09055 [Neglecta sp. X4]|nr:hypothetical protein [Neglectibacter sp. 59]NBJ73444.1 hypothetical protein [Neglectibacter sp. X4]NCE81323.1 hypothetical protein [Neglectibacter sp. X58]
MRRDNVSSYFRLDLSVAGRQDGSKTGIRRQVLAQRNDCRSGAGNAGGKCALAGRGRRVNERDKPDIPELKPCRYCGGRAEIVKERFTYFEPRPLILCHECGLTTREFETVEEAVAYWNN